MKKDKGKKVLSLEEAVKESTESDSDDDETHLFGSMVESSRIKKKIEEEAKAEVAKRESEVRKEKLIDLLGPEVVNEYYNDRKDGTSEVISYFKASDMHLGEWREVVKACPNRSGKRMANYRWSDKKMDHLHTTEAELGLRKKYRLNLKNDMPPRDK
ncbi:hypothetical protein Tco_0326983 [Tanacetum coccineum]